jgi:TP901 family phage tail tape measure protein
VASLGQAYVTLRANTKLFTRSMQMAKAGFVKSMLVMRNSMRAFSGAFVGMTSMLGGGLALGVMLKDMMVFEDKMTQALAIMGDEADKFRGKMEEAAMKIGRSTMFGADKAAEAYYFIASAGFNAQESMAMLPTVANFAQAGMMDLAEATSMLSDSVNALGIRTGDLQTDMDNFTYLSDRLAKANSVANASMREFAQTLQNRWAGAMKSMNMQINEGIAVMAAYANQGRKGAVAGNELTMFFRDLTNAAVNNKAAFKKFGVSVMDARGNMRPVADILEDFEGAFAGMSLEQKKAALGMMGLTSNAADVGNMLIGTSADIRQFEKDMENADGVTKQMAEKQMNSTIAQLKRLRNAFMEVSIQIGSVLLPHMKNFVEAMAEMVFGFADYLKSLKDAETGQVNWNQAIEDFGKIAPYAIAATAMALKALMGTFMGPFAAIGAVIAAGAWVWNNYKEEIIAAKETAMAFFESLIPPLLSVWDTMKGWINWVVGTALVIWDDMAPSMMGAIDAVKGVMMDLWDGIAGIWERNSDKIKRVLMNMLDVARNIVKGIFDAFTWLVGAIKWVFNKIVDIMEWAFGGNVMDMIWSFMDNMWDALSILTTNWKKSWQYLIAVTAHALMVVWDKIVMVFNTIKAVIVSYFTFIGTFMIEVFKNIGAAIFNFARGTVRIIKAVGAAIAAAMPGGESPSEAYARSMSESEGMWGGGKKISNPFEEAKNAAVDAMIDHMGPDSPYKDEIDELRKNKDQIWADMKNERDTKRDAEQAEVKDFVENEKFTKPIEDFVGGAVGKIKGAGEEEEEKVEEKKEEEKKEKKKAPVVGGAAQGKGGGKSGPVGFVGLAEMSKKIQGALTGDDLLKQQLIEQKKNNKLVEKNFKENEKIKDAINDNNRMRDFNAGMRLA